MADDRGAAACGAFIVLAAVFVLVRVMLLLFWPETYTFLEELYSGVVAMVFHDGFLLPIMEYMWHPYEGGTLIFGLSAVPFFKILGPTYLALKATAAAYAFLTFALWYFFMARFFGRASALFCGLLFCFPPIGLTRLFFCAMGTIPQNPAFDVLILSSFYRFYFADAGGRPSGPGGFPVRRQAANACLFGFFGGLGVYFCYFSAITFLACLIAWLVVPGNASGRRCFWGFLAALFVGLLPLLCHNVGHPFSGLKTIIDTMPGREWAAPTLAAGLRIFLRLLLWDGYWFGDSAYGGFVRCYRLLYSTLIVCSFLWIVARRGRLILASFLRPAFTRRPAVYEKADYLDLPILLYIALFFAIAVGTHMERKIGGDVQGGSFVAYRYFAVLLPYLFCVAALFLARLWESRAGIARAIALSAAGGMVFFCAASLPLRFGGIAPAAFHKGYRYYLMGWKVALTAGDSDAIGKKMGLGSMLADPDDRADFIDGFCEIFWWGAIETDEIPLKEGRPAAGVDNDIRQNVGAIEARIENLDRGHAREFYKALGRVLCMRYVYERNYQVDRCLSLFERTNPDFRGAVFEGMGQVAGSVDPGRRKIGLLAPRIPAAYRGDFTRGMAEAARKPYVQVAL